MRMLRAQTQSKTYVFDWQVRIRTLNYLLIRTFKSLLDRAVTSYLQAPTSLKKKGGRQAIELRPKAAAAEAST